MTPLDKLDFDVYKFLAGFAGAVSSMKFVNGTLIERALMVLGGCSLSYFGTEILSDWLSLSNATGLVGFLVGLFGMAIVAKLYEAIYAIDAGEEGRSIWRWFKRRIGIGE